jgi:hypothetical protein
MGGGGESHGGHGGDTVAAKEPETNDTRMAPTPASRCVLASDARMASNARTRFAACFGPGCAPLASAKVPPTLASNDPRRCVRVLPDAAQPYCIAATCMSHPSIFDTDHR